MRTHLERAYFQVSDDGRRARLPTSRALPGILLFLAACGVAMLVYFLVQPSGSFSVVVGLAAAGVALLGYVGVRGLVNATEIAFEDGVFRCRSGALGLYASVEIAWSDLVRFVGLPPAHAKDVTHMVAVLRNGERIRLPILVEDVDITGRGVLARELAETLDRMLDEARRANPGYR